MLQMPCEHQLSLSYFIKCLSIRGISDRRMNVNTTAKHPKEKAPIKELPSDSTGLKGCSVSRSEKNVTINIYI